MALSAASASSNCLMRFSRSSFSSKSRSFSRLSVSTSSATARCASHCAWTSNTLACISTSRLSSPICSSVFWICASNLAIFSSRWRCNPSRSLTRCPERTISDCRPAISSSRRSFSTSASALVAATWPSSCSTAAAYSFAMACISSANFTFSSICALRLPRASWRELTIEASASLAACRPSSSRPISSSAESLSASAAFSSCMSSSMVSLAIF
mmetsp:Transcript_18095/g.50628  ORF Transcript_18095/g.50628 Transcript_18095/m.50628 type:complete len:213 (-) Transcript_18095:860-1498(-)